MVNKFKSIVNILSFVTIAAVLDLSCTDYNPFADNSNAKAVVLKKSFNSGDTISIFSKDTISLIITVPELVDSVIVSVEGNRFFQNNRWRADLNRDNNTDNVTQTVAFSFSDTGHKIIEIKTFRTNGENLSHKEYLIVKSPLFQKTINGEINKDFYLYTPSVPEKNIIYVWDFQDTVIESSSSSITVKLLSADEQGTGSLYVTDGYVESPKVSFQFALNDIIAPVIEITNSEPIVNDTITTGNSEFSLQVLITDVGSKDDVSAEINGSIFDIEWDSQHIRVFGGLDTLKTPLQVVITAKDKSINEAEKKVWIKYDPLEEKSKTFSLSVLIPSKDSSISTTNTRTFYGLVRKYNKDPLPILLTFFNQNGEKYTDTLQAEDWYQSMELLPGWNRITIIAQKATELDTLIRWINYDTLLRGKTKPVIMEATVSGSRDNKFISQKYASLNVIAFNEGSKIETVTCNGKFFRQESDYLWKIDSVMLEHTFGGDEFKIVAKTGKDSASKSIDVFYNHRPVITRGPKFPPQLSVGKRYTTTIGFEDGDVTDTVFCALINADTSMHIDNKGNLNWIPEKGDEIKRAFTIRISDGYEYRDSTFFAVVADSGLAIENVYFGNTLEQLPDYFEANKDTMRVNLRPEKGNPEFHYQVEILGTSKTLSVIHDTLTWCPSSLDIGLERVRIIVTDKYYTKDTLLLIVTVVPENRPLSLRCRQINDTLANGALNMRDSSKTVLVPFTIEDLDPDLAEKFTAYVTQGGRTDTILLKNDRLFTVSVNSSLYKHGTDTLMVQVFDRVGHLDQFKVAVDYGIKLQTPQLILPLNNTDIDTNRIAFKWNANKDPSIRYELYMGLKGADMKYIYGGTDTSFVQGIQGNSGMYFWQVFAYNGKERIGSQFGTFNYNSSVSVVIQTSEKEFKKYYIASLDTISVPLRLTNNDPNVQFTAIFQKSRVPLQIKNFEIKSVPDIKDTGWQRIEIVAKDNFNLNADTLNVDVYITLKKLDIILQGKNTLLVNDTLDLRTALKKDTIEFTVGTQVMGLNEEYTIEITQRNTTRIFSLDSSNSFMIVVDPVGQDLVSEIIEITATGTDLISDSKKILVLYNVGVSTVGGTNSMVSLTAGNVAEIVK